MLRFMPGVHAYMGCIVGIGAPRARTQPKRLKLLTTDQLYLWLPAVIVNNQYLLVKR